MTQRRHHRQRGEFEIRVLKDGRLVMIAPDETLLDMARAIAAGPESTESEAGEPECRNTKPRT